MGLLAAGMAALIQRQQAACAGPLPVTYQQGSKSGGQHMCGPGPSVQLTGCWAGKAEFDRETMDPGAAVVTGQRDYLIPVALLTFNGVIATPRKGDQITDPNVPDPVTGLPAVFEVQPMGTEPAWRFADQGRTLYRVHTQQVQ